MEVQVGHFSPTPYVARGLKSDLSVEATFLQLISAVLSTEPVRQMTERA